MGLGDNDTLVAPQPKGIIDPATGKPLGADDPYFGELSDELGDKGFLVTSTDELIPCFQEKLLSDGRYARTVNQHG